MNNITSIGHNNPPSPFEEIETKINDLYEEAKQWLDGEPVTTQQQADALNTLEHNIRNAAKEAEAMRVAEAKPFDDGKKEMQARFNPLIQKGKGKTEKAISTIKAALKPFLLELDRQQREAAEKARMEAEEAERIAQEAMLHRDQTNLDEQEEANRLADEAKAKQAAATKAANVKAHAKGQGRATGLRSVWKAEMSDPREAAKWAWNACNDELMAFIQDQANKAVRDGTRTIQGFNITEHKEV